jgi:hypothetical protein
LSDLVKNVFGHLLNENFVKFILMSILVVDLEVNRTQLMNADRNAGTRVVSPENHSAGMVGVLGHCEIQILSLI